MKKDRQTNVTPGTDATKWQLIAQGDTGAVLTTSGDIIVTRLPLKQTRLPIGVSGSVLTTDGTDPIWSNAEVKMFIMLQTLVQIQIQVLNIYHLKQLIMHYHNFR